MNRPLFLHPAGQMRIAVLGLALVLMLAICAPADADELDRVREELQRLSTRGKAIRQIVDAGPAGRILLTTLTRDVDPRVRAAVGVALRELPGEFSDPLLDRLLRDRDAEVRSAAVSAYLLGGGQRGFVKLKGAFGRDPKLREQIEPSVRYWIGVYVHQELERLLPDDKWIVGVYPGMFKKILRLGRWAKPALLRMFGQMHRERPTTIQLLAGEALAELRDPTTKEALQGIYTESVRHRRYSSVKEITAIALHMLPDSDPDPLNTILGAYKRRAEWNPMRARGEWTFRVGKFYLRLGKTSESISWFKDALRLGNERRKHWLHFNLACAFGLLDKREQSLYHLQQALRAGFGSIDWIKRDTRLDRIRKDSRFAAMLADPKAKLKFALPASEYYE